jgi:hypothetical protein
VSVDIDTIIYLGILSVSLESTVLVSNAYTVGTVKQHASFFLILTVSQ